MNEQELIGEAVPVAGEVNPRKTRFQVSVETQQIYERLAKCAIGETIPYAELTKLIGGDVQDEARGYLTTARKQLMREKIVFGVIYGEGIKRLTDQETVESGQEGIAHIRKHALRTARRVVAIQDFEALPNTVKVRSNTLLSTLGALALCSHPKTVARIGNKVREAAAKLPSRKVLALFANGEKKS